MCYITQFLLNYSKEILIVIHVEIPQWLKHYVEAPFGSELDLKMQVGGGVRVRLEWGGWVGEGEVGGDVWGEGIGWERERVE